MVISWLLFKALSDLLSVRHSLKGIYMGNTVFVDAFI